MFRVPLFDDESLTSYCSRLAAANATTATDFCKDMGFRFQDVIDGSENAIRELAEYGAIPVVRLHAASARETANGLEVQGEVFPRKNYPRTRMRICPDCFRADDGATDRLPEARRYMRRIWALRFLRTCPLHQRPIIDLGPSPLNSPRNHDFVESHGELFDELRHALADNSTRATSDFEHFIVRRLSGHRTDGELLNDMPLNHGAYLCELMGSVRLFGGDVVETDLSEGQLWEAANDGYEFLRHGESGLRQFQDIMHSRHAVISPDDGGRKLYGRMYSILARLVDPAWDRVKHLMRTHAFDTLPLAKVAEIFGRRTESNYLSDNDLRTMTAVRPGHIRKMAVASGLLDPSLLTGGAIHRDVALKVLALLDDWLLPTEAASLLGVTYPNFKRYRDAGMFLPALTSGNGVAINERHSRREIESYLDQIRRKANTVVDAGELKSIIATSKSIGCKLTDIVGLLHTDQLTTVAWDKSKVGLAAFLVDPAEVADSVLVDNNTGISAHQLGKLWHMSREVPLGLVSCGALATTSDVGVRFRGTQRFILRSDAEAFQARCITFTNAMQEFGATKKRVREAIRVANLSPLYPYQDVRALFYDRRALENALRQLEGKAAPSE